MSAPQHGKAVKGHAFRTSLVSAAEAENPTWPPHRFDCECGLEIGRQPAIGFQRARRLHREHKAQVATGESVQ